MFNNLINRHDFTRLIWGIRYGYLPLILSRLTKGHLERILDAWKPRETKPSTWWMIRLFQKRWNRFQSGDENTGFRDYFCSVYLSGRRNLRGLTLGCGEGQKVLHWARTGLFAQIEAYDLSPERLEKAQLMTRQSGLQNCIQYKFGDVNRLELPEGQYDVIFIEHALHHFSPLEPLLKKINDWLAADGYFVFDEYVGPSRFQWTDRQLHLANAVRALIPERFRSHVIDGRTDKKIIRPSRLSMILKDPSEAVQSAEILPLAARFFQEIEVRGYRGAVLHLVLEGIAHNFVTEAPDALSCLHFLFQIEDFLTQTGQVQNDFAVGIYRKKDNRERREV